MTTEQRAEAKLRCMIIDDEPLAVERLQLLLARLDLVNLVGTSYDGESAIRMADELKPELVFLDINMPKMDGMEVARRLNMNGIAPAIIFVTAYDGFAVEAFDLAATDYLLKPVAVERLKRSIARVTEQRHQKLVETSAHSAPQAAGEAAESLPDNRPESPYVHEFWVPHRSELKRVDALQIDRIDAERDYMRLHVGESSYLLHETIKTLEKRLDPAHFIRIHRSHIVRHDNIVSLKHAGGGAWYVLLKDGTEFRIGRTYLKNVKELTGR